MFLCGRKRRMETLVDKPTLVEPLGCGFLLWTNGHPPPTEASRCTGRSGPLALLGFRCNPWSKGGPFVQPWTMFLASHTSDSSSENNPPVYCLIMRIKSVNVSKAFRTAPGTWQGH